jgi:hypothetical protein
MFNSGHILDNINADWIFSRESTILIRLPLANDIGYKRVGRLKKGISGQEQMAARAQQQMSKAYCIYNISEL